MYAWRAALNNNNGPTALIFSRQELPILDQKKYGKASGAEKGAYILSDSEGTPQVILMGSGSEVHLLMEAQEKLKKDGFKARVVSFPSWELFDQQTAAYKEKVFPKSIRARLAVEAGSPIGWCKYVTDEGTTIGIEKFGESAPAEEVFNEYGFTVKNVITKAKSLLKK